MDLCVCVCECVFVSFSSCSAQTYILCWYNWYPVTTYLRSSTLKTRFSKQRHRQWLCHAWDAANVHIVCVYIDKQWKSITVEWKKMPSVWMAQSVIWDYCIVLLKYLVSFFNPCIMFEFCDFFLACRSNCH